VKAEEVLICSVTTVGLEASFESSLAEGLVKRDGVVAPNIISFLVSSFLPAAES
jgi:hypothetical protein